MDSRLDLDDERLNVVGTANIILVDGARLYNEDGIRVSPGSTLNIYGQSGDSGELYLDADTNDNAALGGDEGEGCGTINIYGGHIRALGGSGSYNGGAGIGGGTEGDSGIISISDGDITAESHYEGAGIGSGSGGDGIKITISGGKVYAAGVKGGAGIGGGTTGLSGGGSGGDITISGGEVNGDVDGSYGAGIGSGSGGDGKKTTITLTHSGPNSTRVKASSFYCDIDGDAMVTTVKLDKPFKELYTRRYFGARTYTGMELSIMKVRNINIISLNFGIHQKHPLIVRY